MHIHAHRPIQRASRRTSVHDLSTCLRLWLAFTLPDQRQATRAMASCSPVKASTVESKKPLYCSTSSLEAGRIMRQICTCLRHLRDHMQTAFQKIPFTLVLWKLWRHRNQRCYPLSTRRMPINHHQCYHPHPGQYLNSVFRRVSMI